MRRINIAHGAIGFEVEGQADHIGSLEPQELLARGWSKKAVENYVRVLRVDKPEPLQSAEVTSAAPTKKLLFNP
jgi:hypothetical protein